MNISVESTKAGAAVFGSMVFGTEFPDHSLTYSPSPLVNRRNKENIQQPLASSSLDLSYVESKKVLNFDATTNSPKKRKGNAPHKRAKTAKNDISLTKTNMGPGHHDTNNRDNQPKSRDVTNKKAGLKILNTSNVSGEKNSSSGSSVNSSINDLRRSKEENIKEKKHTVAEIREQRRLEKKEALAFNEEAEQTRREILELRKQLSERFRRAKIDRERKMREEHISKVESEIQFKSMVHVEHKKTIKETEDMRRRMSIDARAKLRKNHREGKEQLRLASIQEDQAIFEERHESSVAMRNTNATNAEKRRKSFAFRNGDAHRIRVLFAQKEQDKLQHEHESYELKWAGERDADAYKKQMAQERRESLAFRNAEGVRIRDTEAQMKAEDLHNEHESYELKWAGERDADDYKKQMAQERRESLAFRNAEASRHDDLMKELLSLTREREHESYMLKWAGENDAKKYLSEQEELRRQSFAFRNAEGRRHREIEEETRGNAVVENAKNEELSAACKFPRFLH